jgi:DNA-binding response OmpR family regulator
MNSGAKILVVDDESDVLMLCRVNLEYEGYDVVEAHNGQEALERVAQESPDLILLDVMMAGMDGWQVLKTLKNNPETSNIPVVMLTAKVTERDQITGLTGGASDYITKPFNPVALSKSVREALDPDVVENIEERKAQTIEKLRWMEGQSGNGSAASSQ